MPILHRDALLLGYKFNQISRDKALSKIFRTESDSVGMSLPRGLEQQTLHKGFSGKPVGLGPTHCTFAKKQFDSQPDSWLMGLVLYPQRQTSSGRDETWTSVCLIAIYVRVLLNEGHISAWYGEKSLEKESFPPLSCFPHGPRRKILASVKNIFCVSIQVFYFARERSCLWAELICWVFFQLQKFEPWCYW